jgi:hypothetical protein
MPSYPSHIAQTPSIENRSRRISQLLPFISGLRNSNDANSRRVAVSLQESARDLEKLNEIESWIERHKNKDVDLVQQMTVNQLSEILSRE